MESDVVEMRRCDAGPLGAGSEWDGLYKGMGPMRVRIDEYERPRKLVFSTTGSKVDMRLAFTFAPAGSGTQMAAEGEARLKGALRLLAPLMPPMVKRTYSRRPGQIAAGLAAHRAA